MKMHRQGVNELYLTKRTLRLSEVPAGERHLIMDEIDRLDGVDAVNWQKNRLEIDYDASKRSIDDIGRVLEQHGAGLPHGMLSRFKLGWYRYTDHNMRETAGH